MKYLLIVFLLLISFTCYSETNNTNTDVKVTCTVKDKIVPCEVVVKTPVEEEGLLTFLFRVLFLGIVSGVLGLVVVAGLTNGKMGRRR